MLKSERVSGQLFPGVRRGKRGARLLLGVLSGLVLTGTGRPEASGVSGGKRVTMTG